MPEKSIAVRPLSSVDLEPVIAIDRIASGAARRGYFEKRLKAATDNPRDYVFVGAFDGKTLAGFAFAKLEHGAFGKTGASASLDAIGVEHGHGLQGIGHRLLDEVEKVLRHKGVSELNSQVDWSQVALLSFFAHSGFALSPRLVLTRASDELPHELADDPADDMAEIDFSSPDGDAANALSRDRFPVRSMSASDLPKIVAIDAASTGTDRRDYFARRQDEALNQSGIRVSLVAEQDGFVAGFIMARVDYGEFGRAGAQAVMDAIGVDQGFRGQGIGRFLMAKLMANLKALQVESVRTEVDWDDTALIGYFSAAGFGPAQRVSLTKSL
jgi:ribosomal protein S18 acetylase RimI-like enzyme